VRRYTLFGSFSNFTAISWRFVCLSLYLSVSVSISQQKTLGRTLVQYYCCLNFVATKSGTEKRERERERRGGGDGGLFVRTDRSLAGFELGTYALGALLDGKPRGKEDGWMDLGQNARGSSFFFQMALLFFFFFFFSFGFPRKL
jgi:hypothetical protein